MGSLENTEIARRLEEVARLLSERESTPFRAHAYHRAAETILRLDRPVSEIVRSGGLPALRELPGIGDSLARCINELVKTGRMSVLERLRADLDPVTLLASVPGVGPVLARRLHQDLAISTLEDLESAAHDGRLEHIAGVGDKRLAGIIDSLAARLNRFRPQPGSEPSDQPPVEELLDVDAEYRAKAASGLLHRIAPRRFNPEGRAWLPVLHTRRGNRSYTAMFSNTARAHDLHRTDDWVVLYHGVDRLDRQNTVVTARTGPLAGHRVVRGREEECERLHGSPAPWGPGEPAAAPP